MKISTPSEPGKMLPLVPAMFHILLALADQERHGYGIMLEVERNTDGELDDERRRYYRLTDYGRSMLQAEIARLKRLLHVAQAKQVPNLDVNRAAGRAYR